MRRRQSFSTMGITAGARGGWWALGIGLMVVVCAIVAVVAVRAGSASPSATSEIGGSMGELQKRTGDVFSRGNPVTLLGPDVKVGDKAPEFRAVDMAFQPVDFASLRGKPVLIAAVPSLDTGVCSLETRHFNEEAAKLPPDVQIITISMDLPFAQKRFCDAEHVDRVTVWSDHVWREFGTRYGVLTEDKALLARSIFVVGRDGRIVYRELVRDQGTEPNYVAALQAIRQAAAS